ncbi:hypothetical protein TIFTF001_011472 [Ficus carica]|uniref:Uncharacterized protein n=1 Tax=Ficus carica TaxID=3494 RepID=A0AA88A0H4_FICCA|nr:hypothetical protein TIFTF001_011472 [Ficus carica]
MNSPPGNTCEARAIASFVASCSAAIADIHPGKRRLDLSGLRIIIAIIRHSPSRASVRQGPS